VILRQRPNTIEYTSAILCVDRIILKASFVDCVRIFMPQDTLKARAIEDRLYAQTWLSLEYDLLVRLRKLKVPTLVIHGDYDLVPLECVRNIAEAVFGSRLVVLSDCGHFAYLERPTEVRNAIVHFFAQC
jgi:pimeloyl-ACP methyl ester carboxylesterase